MQILDGETRAQRPALELVLERLLEVLLIVALRCGAETAVSPGLSRGLADERLGAALCAFPARPEYPWSVAELAKEASLSRSAFFARFSRTVGVPPMEYLLAWRMTLAKRLLGERQLGGLTGPSGGRKAGGCVATASVNAGIAECLKWTTGLIRLLSMPAWLLAGCEK